MLDLSQLVARVEQASAQGGPNCTKCAHCIDVAEGNNGEKHAINLCKILETMAMALPQIHGGKAPLPFDPLETAKLCQYYAVRSDLTDPVELAENEKPENFRRGSRHESERFERRR